MDPWNDLKTAHRYEPRPWNKFEVQLSQTATRMLWAACATKHSKKPTYVLVSFDGTLREKKSVFNHYGEALEIAKLENKIIFNGRSKTAVRVVWYEQQVELRLPMKFTLEMVQLIPALDALKGIDTPQKEAMLKKAFNL